MKRLYVILGLMLAFGIVIGFAITKVPYISNRNASKEQALIGQNANPSPEQLKKQIEQLKLLNESPIAKITRNILNIVVATNTKAQAGFLSNPPFKNLNGSLTDAKLQSKFFVLSGQEIPDVGAHIYITFINEPDAIFRVAYQSTRSTTTPFIITSFEKTDDKEENIANFLKPVQQYLKEPGMTQ